MQTGTRPQLVDPRTVATLEAVRTIAGGAFDVDIFHAMDQRDSELISDEILNGAGSAAFVYDFTIQGQQITGISVVGARHLAAHYKGLKHRLVASAQKNGPLLTFTSFPSEGLPMAVSCSVINELASEPDYYSCVVELADVKSGNTIQVERREARFESRRDGSAYERPNYQTIAQSKAYRNAVLATIPQDIQLRWKTEMLRIGKKETITDSVITAKRQNVLRFAAQHGVAIERHAVEALTLAQISGLGDAAREGRVPAFAQAASALGLMLSDREETPVNVAEAPQEEAPRRGRPRGSRNAPPPQHGNEPIVGGPVDNPEPPGPVEEEGYPGSLVTPRRPEPAAPPPPPRPRGVEFDL